jgi:predicted alpha/beta hydrolase family esterase
MIKKLKVIFIHGNGGCTPDDNWFPYLKTQLEKLDVAVVARQFPDAGLARASFWLPFLKNELEADENTIIVGHSSGALAAMRFAENNKLLGSVLIAAMHTDLGIESERLSGYFDAPWNWQNIKNNQSWIVQFASTDDPWIPISEPRFVHQKLNSEYHEFKNEGHFGGDRYKREFPELVAVLKKKLLL